VAKVTEKGIEGEVVLGHRNRLLHG
jgi:hypothetical protein